MSSNHSGFYIMHCKAAAAEAASTAAAAATTSTANGNNYRRNPLNPKLLNPKP